MAAPGRYRRLIHYALIVCTLLVQVAILVFFRNEYANRQKLDVLEKQMHQTRVLREMMADARKDLIDAQLSLQKYSADRERGHIESYFVSMRKLSDQLDSVSHFENVNPTLKLFLDSRKSQSAELPNLERIIDSVFTASLRPPPKDTPLQVRKLEIDTPAIHLSEVQVEQVIDSAQKRGFFRRLFNAIGNKPQTQKEVTTITTIYTDSVDWQAVQENFNQIINEIQTHYEGEIKKYKQHVEVTSKRKDDLGSIYGTLFELANDWMEIFDFAIMDLSLDLERAYLEQNSANRRMRNLTLMGMMLLLFILLILIMRYTRLAFKSEKQLAAANIEIANNLKFKDRILGMLTHEIRSPLKIMNLFLNRIRKKSDDPQVAEYLDNIQFTNESLLIQANQILDYARNQEKPPELKSVRFDLKEKLIEILHSFQPFIESGNNTFEIEDHIEKETVVYSDYSLIYRLFSNLLGNANKFTENGKVSVVYGTTDEEDDNIILNVSISDTGSGIAKEELENIFEPFYRSRVAKGLEKPGAGLGLNLCKEIIDLFDGDIGVESELGEGTKVFFSLKLQKNG